MKSTTRRTGIAATLLAATLLLSACQNLPRRVAGTKCKTVGEHAQDGTWVLKCGSNKRWNKLMTIAAANDAVANWLRSQVPAAPTTTAPPAPGAITSFGPITNARVADRPDHVKPGTYFTTVPAGSVCEVTVFGATRRLGTEGPQYMELVGTENFSATGPCTWTNQSPDTQTMPASGNGMYRVGREIGLGVYVAPGSNAGTCYWETATDATGTVDAVTDIYYGDGPQLVVIDDKDKYFASEGCGPWTPLPVAPDRFLQIVSTPGLPFGGARAFYAGVDVTATATAGLVTVNAGAYQITISPPSGGTYTTGVHDFFSSSNVNQYGVGIQRGNKVCTLLSGALRIDTVTVGGSNDATSMRVTGVGRCDGLPIAFDVKY